MSLDFIRNKIVVVPDFPKQGIMFRDITPLLADPKGLQLTIKAMTELLKEKSIYPSIIAGIESRGFIFAAALAEVLGIGFVPIRKPGKLPRDTHRVSYQLEYDSNILEIHQDAINCQDRVLIVDDLLATGGTARAAAELVGKTQAQILAFIFVIELNGLKGRQALKDYPVSKLLKL